MADSNSTDTVEPQRLIASTISTLHALRWATNQVESGDGMDGLLRLLDVLLPKMGADLEAAHVGMGGSKLGLFSIGQIGVSHA